MSKSVERWNREFLLHKKMSGTRRKNARSTLSSSRSSISIPLLLIISMAAGAHAFCTPPRPLLSAHPLRRAPLVRQGARMSLQSIEAEALAAAGGAVVGGLLVAAIMGRQGVSPKIERLGTEDPRSSAVVKHNGVVTISGQVAIIDQLDQSDITEQTKQTLAKVDKLLEMAGTDKSKLLEARIWVKDISKDFVAMNAVWNAWIDPENKPTRVCVEAPMARPSILVEVQVTAAV
jgi:enamine deaminase RidA (YjgF/YER057c/UK114 family)